MNPWGIRKARGQYKRHSHALDALIAYKIIAQKNCKCPEAKRQHGFKPGKVPIPVEYCGICLRSFEVQL